MTRLGIFVGERGNWTFFHELYRDFQQHFEVDVFEPKQFQTPILHGRLNRWSFQHGIRQRLRRNDVCFFEWASELLVPASHMPRICPIITRLHSFELHVWAPKVNWEHVDRVILVSESMRQKFCAAYPAAGHKTQVIYNGVPLDRYTAERDGSFRFNLGVLANFHPVKRIYELVIMLSRLRDRGFEPHLHLAGDRWPDGYFDDYYVAVRRAVEKLDLAPCVTFHGYVQDPARWLRDIDIFISHSYWEGHQVALVEAMAAGCYCLAHFWDGVEEVLPADNVYVTEDSLIAKIAAFGQMTQDERRRRQLGLRDIVRDRFSSGTQAEHMRRLIADVVQPA